MKIKNKKKIIKKLLTYDLEFATTCSGMGEGPPPTAP